MAAAILRLATNKVEREKFSINAEAAFHERFTLQTMVDAYMELYQNTPRSRRGASR
jgi:glycosyltransferase involved in cell wall biosynthesis